MHQDPVAVIAQTLGGARKSGNNWSCRCPAHDDHRASLSLAQKPEGKLLVHCHAGCSQEDVIHQLKAMGLWKNGSHPPRETEPTVRINYKTLGSKASDLVTMAPPQPKPIPRILDVYPYTDENGQLLFECVRMEPKEFRQRCRNKNGQFNWSIKDVRRVIYNLPAVLQAVREGERIYIVEGEKDVETAKRLGLVATCNPMGADNGTGNKWFSEWGAWFGGAEVVIIPDKDEAGWRHAQWVHSAIKANAYKISMAIPLVGKDLSDWVEHGATVADIEAAIEPFVAPSTEPEPQEAPSKLFVKVEDLIDNIQPIKWTIENYVERDSLTLIYGPPSSGKSLLSIAWACCIATGTPWLGQHKTHRGSVFYVAAEGLNGLARRFKAWSIQNKISLKGAPLYQSKRGIQVLDRQSVEELVAEIEEIERKTGEVPELVAIDTVARSFGSGDENSTEDMSNFIQNIDELIRKRWGLTVLLVHHSGHTEGRARGSSALNAAMDSVFGMFAEDKDVTLVCTKMKEAEYPAELYLKIKGVDLGIVDADGHPVTGGVLTEPDDLIVRKLTNDRNGTPIHTHEVLNILVKEWQSIRDLSKTLNCTFRQSRNIFAELTRHGYISKNTVTEEGRAALSRTGIHFKDKFDE